MGDVVQFTGKPAEPINEAIEDEGEVHRRIACSVCRNKTFTLIPDDDSGAFPIMECSCCGQSLGRIGWLVDG